MTAVKVGDRVRATCGENVIVGKVTSKNACGEIYVFVDEDDHLRAFALSRWTVEILPPLIPDVVGTIVRDWLGDAWLHYDGVWWRTGSTASRVLANVEENFGPLTVLWTPEVTS